jgi:C4-type Zn-finger protein
MKRAPKFMDRHGHATRLYCPECGDHCRTIKPLTRTSEYPYPHWMNGDTGVCQCGVSLVVKADGERADLCVANDEHNDERAAKLLEGDL